MTDPRVASDYTPLRTNMEFEELTLPRDKFNRFRYFFVVRPRFTFVLFLDLAVIGIFSAWHKLRGTDSISIVLFLFIIAIKFYILFTFIDDYNMVGIRNDTHNSVILLGEVVKFRPGLDGDKWDHIAARLNSAFHRNSNNRTPYFFYDGADCHSYFEWEYVKRSTSTVTGANRSETVNLVQPMIDEAVKVYKESLGEYWGQYTAEVNQNNVRNDSDKDQTVS